MSARPAKQARSMRNDARIRQAAVSVLASEGWGRLSFSRVAVACGLSARPLRDRFAGPEDLAVAVWTEDVSAPLVEALSAVCELVRPGSGGADPADLTRALQPFVRPEPMLQAAAELMVVSWFEPALGGQVAASLAEFPFSGTPVQPDERAHAARAGYLAALALGLLLTSRRPGIGDLDLSGDVGDIARAVSTPVACVPVPSGRAPHLDENGVFEDADADRSRLLQAALDEVGTRGYERATIEAIVRRAGCSQGYLFARYPTKRELFLDATARMTGTATALNQAYLDAVARQYSRGVAEAVGIREFMRPGRDRQRVVNLEQWRISWHDEVVAEAMEAALEPVLAGIFPGLAQRDEVDRARASIHVGLAMGAGTVLLAGPAPKAWQLPWAVVTVPLVDRERSS